MKGTWVICWIVLAARVAHAGHAIIVMSDPERSGALQVALANRGVAVARLPAPEGELRLERAAAAQRAALQLGAEAAVWVDPGGGNFEVCAVSPDGRTFRHAPLPADPSEGTARVFAAIAASLVDEMLAPPEPAVDVDVDVHVHVGEDGHTDATATPREAPPGFIEPRGPGAAPPIAIDAPADAVARIPHADRTLFELGPMVSPLTAGLEGEVAFPLDPKYRFGVFGGASRAFGDDIFVFHGGLELRDVAVRGTHNHFDVGAIAGAATAHDQGSTRGWETIGYAGARLAYTWEGATSSRTLSLSPILASDGRDTIPAAYASFHWGFAL